MAEGLCFSLRHFCYCFRCNADKKSRTNLMKRKFAVMGISVFRKRLHLVIKMYCLWYNRCGMIY